MHVVNVFHSYSEMSDMKYVLILLEYLSLSCDSSDIKGTAYCAMDRGSIPGTIRDYSLRIASRLSLWITQPHIQRVLSSLFTKTVHRNGTEHEI